MQVNNLQLINFRNYSNYNIGFEEGLNFIIGKNAVGKTNIIEAIYFLESGRSHRTGKFQELIKWNEDFSTIKAHIKRLDRELSIEASIVKESGKQLKVNGVVIRAAQVKSRPVLTVIFTPDHLKIVKGSPEHRRAYIDEILTKVRSDYAYWRQQYAKVMRQRNMLLKRISAGRMRKDVIDYWDKQLVEAGLKILVARKNILNNLEGYASNAYKRISEGSTGLSLKYESQLVLEGESTDSTEKKYLEELEKKRKLEIERGVTLVGPHRDDIGIFVSDVDLRVYGSQGEQRSAALALKIAELELTSDLVKDRPIFLLDDVMSELDRSRRKALLSQISEDVQVIITSTNVEYLEEMNLSRTNVIKVS